MIDRIRQLNDALLQLILTIFGYGIVVELVGVWFVSDKLHYTTGLIIGIACAVGMAIHLAVVIRDAVDMGEGHERQLKAKSVLRYLVVVIIFFVMMKFKLGMLIPAFIGVLGLKVAAYLQPIVNKILHKEEKGKEEEVK